MNPDGTPKTMMQTAAENMARTNAATTIAPALIGADPNGGVAGRVASITASGSPLMELAKTSGTQMAAKRGITNSTLAGEAEQNAVIGAATPIANADAGLWQQAQQANQSAINTAGATSAQLTESARQSDNSLQMTMKQLDTQKEQFAAQLGVTVQDLALRRDSLTQSQQQFLANLDQQKAQMAQQLVMQRLTGEQQLAVAGVEAGYKQAIQANVNISQAWGSTMQNIATIQNNPQLEGAAKATLIQNNLDAFASFAKFWQKVSGAAATPDMGSTGGAPVPGSSVPGAPSAASAGPSIDDLLNFTQQTPATPGAAAAPAPPPAGGGRVGIGPSYDDLYPAGK
jgi:hypothetical protein